MLFIMLQALIVIAILAIVVVVFWGVQWLADHNMAGIAFSMALVAFIFFLFLTFLWDFAGAVLIYWGLK